VAAGQAAGRLPLGTVMEVMTGAPCPEGGEAVVPVESVKQGADGVRLPVEIRPGQHIARRGSDCPAGTEVLAAGLPLTALRLAVLATVGGARVPVRPPPTVAIVSTGDELVPSDRAPGPTQIRDSNGPMLATMARAAGAEVVAQGHAVDTPRALQRALAGVADVDVLLICGGVSAGRYDFVPEALTAWGARTLFHRVRQKPGKPMLVATRGRQMIFALPGNPLSAHLGFHRYAWPAIRVMMGLNPIGPSATGVLAEEVRVKGERTLFQTCRVHADAGRWLVTPLDTRGSADLFTAAAADALVRLEPSARAHRAGSEVSFEWLLTTGRAH
jgi:molybdopterin molybdotransferase